MYYRRSNARVWTGVIVLAVGSMWCSSVMAGVCACDGDVAPPFDGFIGPMDVLIALNCALGTADPADCTLADVDCDGQFTLCDVGNVVQQFRGFTNTCATPCGACCLGAGGCEFEQADFCADGLNGLFTDFIGTYFGDNTPCSHVNCVTGQIVPATSEWGLVTLTIIMLTCGTLIVRRRGSTENGCTV